jgi:hypothetical protein
VTVLDFALADSLVAVEGNIALTHELRKRHWPASELAREHLGVSAERSRAQRPRTEREPA